MEETTISLNDVWKAGKKRKSLIVNITLTAVILAVAVNLLVPPTYEAATDLRVKQPKGLAESLLSQLPGNSSFNTKQLMSTYSEMLKSRSVIQTVIDKTQADKAKMPTYEEMAGRITVMPLKDTELLRVKVQAGSAQEAQAFANTLMETFSERLTKLVRAEQTGVRNFIGQRVQESRLELDKAESALEQYKRSEKMLAPADESKALLERMTNVKKMIAENAVSTAIAQARYRVAQEQLGAEKPGFMADSPLIQQYKGKLADLEVELVGLAQNYGNNHPRIQALQAAIEETRQNLQRETELVINAEAPSQNAIHQGLLQSRIQAEADVAANTAQQQAIQQIIRQSEQEITALPSKEQEFTRLMRDASVAQEIYIMLAKRYEEARISEFMQPSDVQVIDLAGIPQEPVSPKKAFNVIVGALLGFFTGLISAIFFECSNRVIRSSQDAKQMLNLPILGTVPDFNSSCLAPAKHSKKGGFCSRMRRKFTRESNSGE